EAALRLDDHAWPGGYEACADVGLTVDDHPAVMADADRAEHSARRAAMSRAPGDAPIRREEGRRDRLAGIGVDRDAVRREAKHRITRHTLVDPSSAHATLHGRPVYAGPSRLFTSGVGTSLATEEAPHFLPRRGRGVGVVSQRLSAAPGEQSRKLRDVER